MPNSISLALDTGIAVRLGEEDENTHLLLELLSEQGHKLVVTPTVLAELEHHAHNQPGKLGQAATHFLVNRNKWGIIAREFSARETNKSEYLAGQLREKGFVPDNERHDSMILAEASVAKIPVLVAEDRHYHTDNTALANSLKNLGYSPVVVFTPQRLVKKLLG